MSCRAWLEHQSAQRGNLLARGRLAFNVRYFDDAIRSLTMRTLLTNLAYVYNDQETQFSAGRMLMEAGCNLAWQIAKTSPTIRIGATCGIHNTKVRWPGCLQSRYLQSRKLHSWYLRPSLLFTYANFELPFLLTPARVDIRVSGLVNIDIVITSTGEYTTLVCKSAVRVILIQ